MSPTTLLDLGERRIVEELVRPFCPSLGHDCAFVPVGEGTLVVTIDPLPQPAADTLAGDPDPYWGGWLSVVINASDVAAAGGRPLAYVAAVECPTSTETADFVRLLEGIRDACGSEGLTYVGGNIREGEWRIVGTAIGFVSGTQPLTRTGGQPGDVVVSVGQGGIFWRDAFLHLEGNPPNPDTSPLFRPRSQIHVMYELRERRLISCAIDNSDGLLPSLQQLSDSSGVLVELDLSALSVPECEKLDIAPERLWLGWGDWNVIAVLPKANMSEAVKIVESAGAQISRIGRVLDGNPGVLTRRGVTTAPAPRLESERFSRDSWFSAGIDHYVAALLRVDLI